MPTLHWIGKEKVINHHMDVPFKVLEHAYGFAADASTGSATDATTGTATVQKEETKNRASEVGVILENDLFTSTVNDKYYTNGFEIYYRYLTPKKKQNQLKKITEFRVGQYIYNPQTIRAERIDYTPLDFEVIKQRIKEEDVEWQIE